MEAAEVVSSIRTRASARGLAALLAASVAGCALGASAAAACSGHETEDPKGPRVALLERRIARLQAAERYLTRALALAEARWSAQRDAESANFTAAMALCRTSGCRQRREEHRGQSLAASSRRLGEIEQFWLTKFAVKESALKTAEQELRALQR